jgi:hypothetical protein
MTNPYRTQREKAAYEAGLAAGRADKPPDGKKPKPLSRKDVLAMSVSQINERWPEVQAAMTAWADGQDDDDVA